MDLGVDEADPLDDPVALRGAGGRQELGSRITVTDVLQYGPVLGQDIAIVEPQCGHVALGVHRREIGTVLQLFGSDVCLDQVEGHAGLAQRDVWSERAGAGGVVKLHGRILRDGGTRRRPC